MSVPNVEAAREAFAERVADAYRKTWFGYGFVGDEFSFDKSIELGHAAARCAFPLSPMPMTLKIDVDTTALKEAIDKHRGTISAPYEHLAPSAGGCPCNCDDGVVGD